MVDPCHGRELETLVISRAKPSGVPAFLGPPMAVKSCRTDQTEREQLRKIQTAEEAKIFTISMAQPPGVTNVIRVD